MREYAYKPDEPEGNLICNEVFVFAPGRVLDLLDERGRGQRGGGSRRHAAAALVDAGDVREHRFDGFWRDVGTIDAYWSAHMELLADAAADRPRRPGWPILTRAIGRRASARVLPGAEIVAGLLAPGSTVAGRVERSVIGRGARVEAGATVTRLGAAARRRGARRGAGSSARSSTSGSTSGRARRVGARDGDITLIGLAKRIASGAEVPAGGRVPDVG